MQHPVQYLLHKVHPSAVRHRSKRQISRAPGEVGREQLGYIYDCGGSVLPGSLAVGAMVVSEAHPVRHLAQLCSKLRGDRSLRLEARHDQLHARHFVRGPIYDCLLPIQVRAASLIDARSVHRGGLFIFPFSCKLRHLLVLPVHELVFALLCRADHRDYLLHDLPLQQPRHHL